MKKLIAIIRHFLMAAVFVIGSRADGATPVNLRCEYLVNPQGIDVVKPRLSWLMESERRGEQQTACRILVASSADKLAANVGDRWDSGEVATNQSTQVEYNGTPLTSRAICFWKVKVWDSAKNASQWSPPAQWSMGLLQPADWTANWISMKQQTLEELKAQFQTGTTTKPDHYFECRNSPMLRKSFPITRPVKAAQVSIVGMGYYELYLNGAKVGDHVLDPAWTSYHNNALYVTYDIASTLKRGKNAFGVQLANGMYNQGRPDTWLFHKAPWKAFPQMRLQLDITYDDGTQERIVSDESWKASSGPIFWDQLRVGVMYDARREQPGWNTSEFDDSKWQPAVLREGVTGTLAAQACEPIKVMKTLKPVNVAAGTDGVYEFDFGQNIAGWSRLKVSGKEGTEVTMDHGHGQTQTDVYILKGQGEEIWEPGFTYHGFGKVKVTGLPKAPDKNTLDARVVYTSFEDRGAFECSNPLLNKIVDMTRWSYIGNFVGIPTDCPHREKNGWSGDAQIAAEIGLTYYGSEAAYTRWMLDFQAVQALDGKLPCIVPDGGNGWGERFLDGPAWESAYLIIPWHVFEYRGDRRILEHHYENYKRWIAWYRDESKVITKKRFKGEATGNAPGSKYKNPQQVNQGNIIYYGIGDWAGGGNTPFEITSTAYYYNAAKIISRIARLLGKSADEKEYADLAAATKTAFNQAFYDANTGTYSNGSHTGMSAALYFGLVESNNEKRVADNLAEGLRKNDYKIQVGCLGSKFLLRALAEHGHLDTAYKIITNINSPGWGFQAASNRTTLAESLNGGGSDNHVFTGDVAAWMMHYLAGIRHDPAHPGFQRFLIKPEIPADLTWVKAHHDSPYGRIMVAWKRTGGALALDITVPANSVAEVFIPAQQPNAVLESGKPAAKADGVKFLRGENARAIYEVGAGTYHFTSNM